MVALSCLSEIKSALCNIKVSDLVVLYASLSIFFLGFVLFFTTFVKTNPYRYEK